MVLYRCAPLDLLKTQEWLDRSTVNLYRNHCLDGSSVLYAVKRVASSRNIPIAVHWEKLDEIRSIRDWDTHMVVHGSVMKPSMPIIIPSRLDRV